MRRALVDEFNLSQSFSSSRDVSEGTTASSTQGMGDGFECVSMSESRDSEIFSDGCPSYFSWSSSSGIGIDRLSNSALDAAEHHDQEDMEDLDP